MRDSQLYIPYAESKTIKGIQFNWSSHKRIAPGSDNWPLTWADDDHQYTTFGDGGGFEGSNKIGRTSLGIGRVEGTKDDYKGFNVWGGYNAENPSQFTGKSWGIVCVDGILYMWRSGKASHDCYEFQQLFMSENHGATWRETGVEFKIEDFRRSRGFFVPTFLQFEKDYSGARDNYVYIYATELKSLIWELQVPGEISLIRVPRDKIAIREQYEFFAGFENDIKPIWSYDVEKRRPVFYDVNGAMRINAVYNPALEKYLLISQHTARNYGWGIFEAPEPWGPWRTIYYEKEFPHYECKLVSYMSISPKWWGNDGHEFVMVFSGREHNDAWNSIEGSFLMR